MKCQCDTINNYKDRDNRWVAERRCGALGPPLTKPECLLPEPEKD